MSKRTRLPITMSTLHKICVLLQSGIFDTFTPACSKPPAQLHFSVSYDVVNSLFFKINSTLTFCPLMMLFFKPTHVTITTRKSKTNPFRHGIHLKLFRTNQSICPVVHSSTLTVLPQSTTSYLYHKRRLNLDKTLFHFKV
jgi:hypothetical protein